MVKGKTSKATGPLVACILIVILAFGGVLIYIGMKSAGEVTVVEHPAPEVSNPFNSGDADSYVSGDLKGLDAMTDMSVYIPKDAFYPTNMGIVVPDDGIHAPMVNVGLGEGNNMVIPESSEMGHYTEAAALGALEGSTVIVGHVNYPDASWAPMAPLSYAKKGAPVFVQGKDGERYQYKIVSSQTILKQALPDELFLKTGKPQLVLITCGGKVEYDSRGVALYANNTVVIAEPVS